MTRVSWSRMYTLPATSWSVSVRSPTKVTCHREGLTLAMSHEEKNNAWNEMRQQRQRVAMIAASVCVWSLIRTSAVFPPWGCGSAKARGTNKVTWQQFDFISWISEPPKRNILVFKCWFYRSFEEHFWSSASLRGFSRPNPTLSCPQTLDLDLIWSKLCCKLLRWSRVATKPA